MTTRPSDIHDPSSTESPGARSGPGGDERKPYEPPAVLSEEVFETLAVACGKTGGARCIAGGGARS